MIYIKNKIIKMNIIGIDPSLISTALVIGNEKEFKIFNYCKEDNISTKTGLKKWFKSCEQYVNYKNITYDNYDNYSNGEIIKLHDYNKITDNIIKDILDNINPDEETKIGIEGYSFASNFGDIIDLVTFSTLLRSKIIDKVTKDLTIISPSGLKLESCKLTYKPINIGKKKEKLKYVNTRLVWVEMEYFIIKHSQKISGVGIYSEILSSTCTIKKNDKFKLPLFICSSSSPIQSLLR